jgi:hypothetical protein
VLIEVIGEEVQDMPRKHLLLAAALLTVMPSAVHADPFKWSYSNVTPVADGGKVAFIHRVDGTYTDPTTGKETERWVAQNFGVPGLAVPPRTKATSNVSESPKGTSPTDYHIIVDDPGFTTDTTLAFLVGSTGSFRMLDLGQASRSRGFIDDNEFLVPGLSSDTMDIYAAVNLSQWLSSLAPITPNQAITLTNGVSDLLPGFLVSASPIAFNMTSGFTASDLVSGTVYERAILDGSAIPEPSTLALLGISILGVLAFRRRGRIAQTSIPPPSG